MPTVEAQEESCVGGAQGVLDNESILTHSVYSYDVDICVCKKNKIQRSSIHTTPPRDKAEKHNRRKTAVDADVHNYFSGLYLPCSTHSDLTMAMRGEGKPELSWLQGGLPWTIFIVTMCSHRFHTEA